MWFMAVAQDRGVRVLAISIVLAAIGWILPWTWTEPAAIAVFAVAVGGAVLWALLKRIPNPAVARALDRRFETEDALTTALQFSPTEPFGEAIHERANAHADGDVRAAFPLRWRPRRMTLLAVLLLVFLVLVATANPQDDRRAEIAAEEQRLEELAQDFNDEADELREAQDEASQALAEALDEAAEAIRTTGDTDLAAAGLDQAQTDLLRTLDAESLAQRAAVVGLERSLDNEPFPGFDATQTAASPADQLSSIADSLTELSEAQQAALANQLGRLADAQDLGDPATAEALRGAEEALIRGDVISAARELEEASQAAGVATEAAGEANAVADAAAAAAQSAQDIRDPDTAGEGGTDGATPGAGGGQSDSSGSGGGSGAPDGAPPAATDTGAEADQNQPIGEVEQVDVDSIVSGDGSGSTVSDDRVITPAAGGAAAVLVDSLPSEFSQQAVESLDGSTNISGNEAATVANYFDLLIEDTP